MSMASHPSETISRLVLALGLNPKRLRSINLRMAVGELVTAETVEYVTQDDMKTFTGEVEAGEYVLVSMDHLRWIPVTERLPKIGTKVLAVMHSSPDEVDLMTLRQGTDLWEWEGDVDFYQVSHWMPIAPPPARRTL